MNRNLEIIRNLSFGCSHDKGFCDEAEAHFATIHMLSAALMDAKCEWRGPTPNGNFVAGCVPVGTNGWPRMYVDAMQHCPHCGKTLITSS
jgi:hypothetical protein